MRKLLKYDGFAADWPLVVLFVGVEELAEPVGLIVVLLLLVMD